MPDKSVQRNSVDEAAKVFGALLFPKLEGQDDDEELEQQHDEQDDAAADEPDEGETPDSGDASPDTKDDDSTDDDEEAEPANPPKKVKVKDEETGELVEVDEEEAHRGYLRVQDYTRKTTNAATLRKQAEADLAIAAEHREAYAAKLAEATQWLDSVAPAEPNWMELRSKLTPEKYAEVHANWTQVQSARANIKVEQDKVEKARQEEFNKKLAATAIEEQEKLLTVLPEWLDPQVARKELQLLGNWLVSKGYTEEQISSVTDHRLVVNLRNAMLYEQAKSGTPRPTPRKGGRTAAPGSPKPKPKIQTARDRDMTRLQKSGKLSDAARVMMQFVE